MIDRKLAAWGEAGLIDAQTAAAIRAYEASHARPVALWAVIGIGALAIGLGVISVVAANWEDVPGTVRLAIHLALMIALGGWLAWRGEALERAQPWGLEAGLFVLGALGLAFFGHLGQVYQTSSPLWQPLATWLVLFAPVILLRGQSWLTALLLTGALVYACWDYARSQYGIFDRQETAPHAWIAFITALPVALAPLGAWMRERSDRRAFWKRLEQLALVYAVGGASLICIAAGVGSSADVFSGDTPMSFASQSVRAGVALMAAALVAAARRRPSGEASAAVLAGAGLASIIAVPVSGSDLMGGLLFMALWVGIAAAALHAGWRGVFQLAVAVIALRLIVLSFELASDLLTSGFGLILAGLLILGVAWLAVRVSRRFAPPRAPEEGA